MSLIVASLPKTLIFLLYVIEVVVVWFVESFHATSSHKSAIFNLTSSDFSNIWWMLDFIENNIVVKFQHPLLNSSCGTGVHAA
jgi:hypothetical protein